MSVDPPQPPQVSPDGRYWWDGRAWQAMPTLSPDGSQWWNGRAWQAIPVAEEAAAPPPELEQQASWAVVETSPQGPPSAPFLGPPAGYAPPSIAPAAPAASGPPARRNVAGDVVLWAGIVVGFLIVMFGGIGIIELHSARSLTTNTVSAWVTIAIAVIIIGSLVMLGCGMRLMGYTMLGLFRPLLSELAIFGTLMLVTLILDDIFILVTPPGTIPFYFPVLAVLTMLYKFWKGKWLAGGALGFFWVLSLLVQLPGYG